MLNIELLWIFLHSSMEGSKQTVGSFTYSKFSFVQRVSQSSTTSRRTAPNGPNRILRREQGHAEKTETIAGQDKIGPSAD